MPRPFAYATRSLIPSRAANAVQSAHMACAFSSLYPDLTVAYRTPKPVLSPADAFAPYGLTPPSRPVPIMLRPILDRLGWGWLGFYRHFRSLPAHTVVYTRHGRLAACALLARRPPVIEIHDPPTPGYYRWLETRRRVGQLRCLVVTTQRLRDDLLARTHFLPADVLVAGGASHAAFLNAPPAPLPSPGFHVGYAGGAHPGKGVEIVLACASRLPDFTFHLLGPTLAEVPCPLPPNVVLHGPLPHALAVRTLKAMHALLLPNQASVLLPDGTDIGAHTSPLKLYDYLVAARPIVASDLPVLTVELRHDHNALLAPPADPDAFCAHLRRLHADPALANRLATTAAHNFAATRSWSARALRIATFLKLLYP